MFWEQSELEELAGTSIAGMYPYVRPMIQHNDVQRIEKIGKDDANEDYRTRIVPLITVSIRFADACHRI